MNAHDGAPIQRVTTILVEELLQLLFDGIWMFLCTAKALSDIGADCERWQAVQKMQVGNFLLLDPTGHV
eukprot:4788101-Amphidinium_carterae.1